MGFHENTVSHVVEGTKTKTYRTRDHGLTVGDRVNFENSQKTEIFGTGTIKAVERKKVKEINLKDKAHHATYEGVDQLIAALKKHHPEMDITPDTEVFVYTYEFTPVKTGKI